MLMSFNFVYSLRYVGCQIALILGSITAPLPGGPIPRGRAPRPGVPAASGKFVQEIQAPEGASNPMVLWLSRVWDNPWRCPTHNSGTVRDNLGLAGPMCRGRVGSDTVSTWGLPTC